MNAVEIEEAVSQLAGRPFDAGEFAFEFLEAFGKKGTTLKRLRAGATNRSDVPRGVLKRDDIHIATCEPGRVPETLATLRASPRTGSEKAKFILATDGETLEAEDLVSGETVATPYAALPDHFGVFLPLAGITTVKQIRESAFDIRATSRLNRLYVRLLEDNPDWATADRRPDMNHFMARLIFCFFAEDTDIFGGQGGFTAIVQQMSAPDSSNTHEVLRDVFRAMNTDHPDRERSGIPRWAGVFPYVNGGLFSGAPEAPRFSRIARSYFLHIGGLDWTKINPDIFGSMIQAVADDEERGALGMHYTSVPNILKVLNPLFLDDLRGKLEQAGDNNRTLLNLRRRMSRIRVFDPACGSGNFLVIAYKQMRAIEAEINGRRGERDRRTDIALTNFRGIELRDFPAEIARLALIIAEYQCDVLYRGQQEALRDFLPLDAENWITCGNALRIDWLAICPPTGAGVRLHSDDLFGTPLQQAEIDFENEGGETYVCGNPQFKGARKQTKAQKEDMCLVFGGGHEYKDCDYVMAWYLKASKFSDANATDFAFVSTNSISRGEQVQHLWARLYPSSDSIFFCYTQFKWSNSAAHNAGVWCVIIGITRDRRRARFIFTGDARREVDTISPYLIAGEENYIRKSDLPIAPAFPKLVSGNMARDGGGLILDERERDDLIRAFPSAGDFLRPLIGTAEIKQGSRRWCVWLDDANADAALLIPAIRARVDRVRDFRVGSIARTTQGYARVAHKFAQRSHEESNSIVVPKNTTDAIRFITPIYVDANTITTDLAFVSYTEETWVLAVLSSTMHRVWAQAISGGLGSGIRYSSQITYNSFPLARLTVKQKADLQACAERILLVREAHFPSTIGELYERGVFPEDLLDAHRNNDEVLERIYIGRRFRNDTERLEKLFELYSKMVATPVRAR